MSEADVDAWPAIPGELDAAELDGGERSPARRRGGRAGLVGSKPLALGAPQPPSCCWKGDLSVVNTNVTVRGPGTWRLTMRPLGQVWSESRMCVRLADIGPLRAQRGVPRCVLACVVLSLTGAHPATRLKLTLVWNADRTPAADWGLESQPTHVSRCNLQHHLS